MCCGFRPFFLGAALWAGLGMLLWMLMLTGLLPMVTAPMVGPAWHAHEMVWGFGMAAVLGFLLTAVPEFTATPFFPPRDTAWLLAFWLAARLFGVAGLAGAQGMAWVGLAALFNLALVAWLAVRIAPRLLFQTGRPHLGFGLAVAALAVLECGFWFDTLRGGASMRWVNALVGVMMVLIVLAQSRISMRLLHGMLDRFGVNAPDYRAPPPRRGLAIFCITLVTTAELLDVSAPTLGWMGLAASAAVLALMTDWHLGRTLFNRWVWPLYAVYVCMAAGFAALGLAWLGAPWLPSAGRHLLTVGSMGLGVLAVMNIAGRIHAGRQLDDRPWRVVATSLLVLAAIARAVAASPYAGGSVLAWWWVAALGWTGAWLLFAIFAWWHLTGPRTDGGVGCEEPREP
ncbi:NnrS family protein [Ottowia thiooxydans]|uniref:NnrS family protein n=1 Tax=Ottowia thiooxydans TaxID=219182 RepID=UPI0003FF0B88|nr:NnrS family protein [Ottowia thiooxydans]